MWKQDLPANGLIRSNLPKPTLTKCEYYSFQAKIRHYEHIFNDTSLNKQWDINKINKTTIIMRSVVMNNVGRKPVREQLVWRYL